MGGRGADRTAIPWNLARPPKPTLVGGPGPGVNSLTVAPDGRTVGTGGNDGTARHVSTSPTGARSGPWPSLSPARVARCSPWLSPRTVTSWPPRGSTSGFGRGTCANQPGPGRLGEPLSGHRPVYTVAFAPDGRTLASGGNDDRAGLWELTDAAQPRPLGPPITTHDSPVNEVVQPWLVTAGGDGRLRVWSLAALTGARERPVEVARTIAGRGLSPQEWLDYVPGLDYRNTCAA